MAAVLPSPSPKMGPHFCSCLPGFSILVSKPQSCRLAILQAGRSAHNSMFCVCVCVWLCVHVMWVCVYGVFVYVYMLVCVLVMGGVYVHVVYVYIGGYGCAFVCVCVWVCVLVIACACLCVLCSPPQSGSPRLLLAPVVPVGETEAGGAQPHAPSVLPAVWPPALWWGWSYGFSGAGLARGPQH